MIQLEQTLSSEVRYLDADTPEGEWTVLSPRERGHEYSADQLGDWFYIRSNRNAQNFRLMKAPLGSKSEKDWQEVVAHRPDVLLEDFLLFDHYLVIQERRDGLVRLRIRNWSGSDEHELSFGEDAYMASAVPNAESNTVLLQYRYASLTTPSSLYDYNMVTREKTLRKQQAVLGGFDSANYRTERLHAPARDGMQIPISLVYRRDLRRPGENPLLLAGYGAYGISIDPTFSSPAISLLDRGFVFAIAHIRGGEDLGRSWYEDGKLLKKKNTFYDFIDSAEFLVTRKYARPGHVYAMGGSAGGLLIGAVANMRPDLFRGMIAEVPFVDVVTTMLDESIPLTTNEYDEWGNPHDPTYYDYILSYSPYDNVRAQNYPHLLVTTGLHDSQVQYWEPAKWVAKLRALKTDQNELLFKIQMEAGHAGPSGRDQGYRETAIRWAFLLDLEGKEK
jgi:oligopeptidase B